MPERFLQVAAAAGAAREAVRRPEPVRVSVRTVPSAVPGCRTPRATFRLQFGPDFGFAQARKLVPFLHRLGISDLYSSPVFQPRKHSSHGYDVTSPLRLNPELGNEEDFEALVRELKRHGMGLVLDFVPNHMAASTENDWWRDVLEDGQRSAFASYFDIDWDAAAPGHCGKVLLPILGGPYGAVLENRELQVAVGEEGFFVRYYEHALPLALSSYTRLLRLRFEAWRSMLGPRHPLPAAVSDLLSSIERLAAWEGEARLSAKRAIKARLWSLYHRETEARAFIEGNLAIYNGCKGDPRSFDPLDGLLAGQAYRLEFWRTGRDKINYRRFFDINELVGMRVEDEEVFGATHSFLLRLIREGKITGLRLDHVDGLHDPAGYLRRLDGCLATLKPQKPYVVAEKILLADERLPEGWPIEGTTGYDFLDAVNAVFVDPFGLERIEAIYRSFTGITAGYEELVYQQKKRIIGELFPGEMNRLCVQIQALAASSRHARELTDADFRAALREVTACLPVYRTYVRALEVSPRDRSTLQRALEAARLRLAGASAQALEFLARVLLLEFPPSFSTEEREEWLRFVMRWQQFTGPVMAKGAEDTACYIYNRLVSMNVVGGSLRPVSVDEFHRLNAERGAVWPHSLNATSTHDTKRSEDVRARINVLSELPEVWERCLACWSQWNLPKKRAAGGALAPDANEETLIYQVLLGAWPLDARELPAFRERMRGFLVKAAREAKVHTNWIRPDEEYERALVEFLSDILTPGSDNCFLQDFQRVQARIAPFGAIGSLGQVLLKATSPGVPDFYQGTLLWDFSLVDPDNRRSVDFGLRAELLEQLKALDGQDPIPLVEHLAENWADGRLKLYVISKALDLRRHASDVFEQGEYVPLEVAGPAREHVVAFARRHGDEWAIAAVPRVFAKLCRGRDPFASASVWNRTSIELPPLAPGRWRNAFTGEILRPGQSGIELSKAFRHLPVLLLTSW